MTTPDLTSKQLDTIARFGFDRPPAADELGAGARAPLDLDAIEARAVAATPGPWIVLPPECGPEGQGVYHAESLGPICEVGDPYPRGDNHPQENMTFIAAAREDVPALAAEVRRLRALVAVLSGAAA